MFHTLGGGEPRTVGCLPMCFLLIHCMADSLRSCLMPEGFSARSPGSWQGGSWVSALLSGLFCLTPSQDLALFVGGLCLFLCKIPIQRHYLPPHWSCLVRALSPVLLLVVAFLCFCVVFALLLLVFGFFWA